LHLADIHLGMENYGRPDPETGLSTRLGDFLASLNRAIDWALENDVHLVIIAGDVFKNRDPTPTVQREFARCVRRLSAAGLPTFIIVGNHDIPNAFKRANSVEIYHTLQVPGVTVAQAPGLHVIDTRAGKVQLVALPWLSRSYILSNSEFRTLDNEGLKRETIAQVEAFIDRKVAELDPALPAILVAHMSVEHATVGAERDIMLGNDVVFPLSVIANPRFDYIALGHIHKHQVIKYGRAPIVYPGSLERIDFGEERDKKGFVVVEIDEPGEDGLRETRYTFEDSGARNFLRVKVNADCEFPTDEVLRRVDERASDMKDSIVRLVIETTPERARDVRIDEIRRAVSATGPAFYQVAMEVERRHRMVLGDQGVEQMNPEQALQVYLQNKGVSPERTQVLVQHYRQLSGTLAEADRPQATD
jgi:exonuclease SbcD